MSYHDRLTAEINAHLDALAAERKPWIAKWVAHTICADHESALAGSNSEHADFWRYCGYKECREMVRACINRRAGSRPDKSEDQESLPGFKHLQSYYLVPRGGDEIGVSIYDMTTDELKLKADLYRQMGIACIQHARELARFMSSRQETAA